MVPSPAKVAAAAAQTVACECGCAIEGALAACDRCGSPPCCVAACCVAATLASPCSLGATLDIAVGPPAPYTGTIPAAPAAAAAAALGRPGNPAAAAAAAQAAAEAELVPRDEAGVGIASAAFVGLGPDGNELPWAVRRALLQTTPLPPAKYVNNTLITPKMTTIIIPSASWWHLIHPVGGEPLCGAACLQWPPPLPPPPLLPMPTPSFLPPPQLPQFKPTSQPAAPALARSCRAAAPACPAPLPS